MPSWSIQAILPGSVFTLFFLLWVLLPARPDERDLGSRIRTFVAVRWRRRKAAP